LIKDPGRFGIGNKVKIGDGFISLSLSLSLVSFICWSKLSPAFYKIHKQHLHLLLLISVQPLTPTSVFLLLLLISIITQIINTQREAPVIKFINNLLSLSRSPPSINLFLSLSLSTSKG
jgi:hypothetical protein